MNDGVQAYESEESVLGIGLICCFGIASQYVKTYIGTPTGEKLRRMLDHIFVETRLALEMVGLPVIFREEAHFWDPTIAKSPFIDS